MTKSSLSRLLRLTVSVVLLTRVAWRTDWDSVRAGFAGMRWEYWLLAVLVLAVSQVVSAWRWQFFAHRLGLPRPLGRLTGFYFIGMYFNLLLPTSVGGDVVRAWYLDGRSGRRWPAFASVLLDRLNGLAVLVALACAGVLTAPLELPAWIIYSVWDIAAVGVIALIAVRILASLDLSHLLNTLEIQNLQNLVKISCQPRLLAATLPLSVCVQVANVLLVWLIGQAIGAPVPAAYYCVMVPMVTLLTLLPISVNGMGVREEATVLFLAPLGIAEGTALTLSVLWFAVCASVSLLGGAVYLFGHFPRPEASAPLSLSPRLPFSKGIGRKQRNKTR